MHVQTFIAQRSIEGFNETVVNRLAGAAEVDAYFVVISPEIE